MFRIGYLYAQIHTDDFCHTPECDTVHESPNLNIGRVGVRTKVVQFYPRAYESISWKILWVLRPRRFGVAYSGKWHRRLLLSILVYIITLIGPI